MSKFAEFINLVDRPKPFIFIHISHTAGRSIRQVIKPYCLNVDGLSKKPQYRKNKYHLYICDIQEWLTNLNQSLEQYTTFAVVRNPWDRLVSRYYSIKQNKRISKQRQSKAYPSFRSYVKYGLLNHGIDLQIDRLTDTGNKKGKIIVNYLLRFESLQSDWEKLANKLKLPTILPTKGKTLHKYYTEYYDIKIKSIVDKAYKPDTKRLQYTFE